MLDLLELPTAEALGDGERVAALLRGFLASKACFAALELGVFEALAQRPLRADALAARLDTHPIATERLCAVLCSLDLLELRGEGYADSPLAQRYLLEASPDYMGDIALLYSWDTYPAYQYLDLAVREGPGWRRNAPQGAALEAVLAQPERVQRLSAALERAGKRAAEALLDRYDVGAHDGLVEVGSGMAQLCIAAARRHPRLRCTFFDQPGACRDAERLIAAAGLSGRVLAWPGNMFAPFAIPRAGDLIVLGQVLHGWDDERALAIVRACADALPRGGTLLIREQLLDPGGQGPAGPALQNLTMLMLGGGRERSAAAYLELIEEAGLEPAGALELAGPFGLLIGRR